MVFRFNDLDIIPGCGENNVGYYAACLTIASLIFITKKSVFKTLKPHIAGNKDSDSMQLVVNKAFKFLVIAIFLQGGFIILFATMLLANFGPSYINYVPVLRILIIGYSVSMIPSLSVFYLLFHGYEKVLLRTNYFIFISTLVFGSLAYYFFGLIGIATAVTLTINISAYTVFFIVKRKTDIKFMVVI